MSNTKLDSKVKFNALSNAEHIFKLKEDGIEFQLIELVKGDDDTKAVAFNRDGEIFGIFTDSKSARSALDDVLNCFGSDQPFIKMHIKETAKGQSVYYAEVI